MKIYDCFMFFDEEMLLDLRLNIMDKYVHKFVITEASYMHSGKPKKLNFNINNFPKFKDKIIYNVVEKPPENLEIINIEDNEEAVGNKLINNSLKRENYQREMGGFQLNQAEDNDLILINDIDEIPDLKNVNFNNINEKLIIFKQKMYYYKFNLLYKNLIWHGSKACKKKHFISPQWLRNVRHRRYSFWRLDIFFSKKKYNDIYYVENGGWHFSNMKSPEDLQKKYLNFLHHHDFEDSGMQLNDIKEKIDSKRVLYDLGADKRDSKWEGKKKLLKVELSEMPDFLSLNYKKYSDWLD